MLEVLIILFLSIILIIVVRKLPYLELKEIKRDVQKQKEELSKPTHISQQEQINIEEALSHAETLFEEKNYPEAEKIYLQVIAQNPTAVHAYNRLGLIYMEQKNFSDAKEAFSHALKIDPQNAFIYNNLGLVLYNQGKYKEAITFYKKAIAIDSLVASRYVNLALAYQALRAFREAIEAYRKAIALEPHNEEYKMALETLERKLEIEEKKKFRWRLPRFKR